MFSFSPIHSDSANKISGLKTKIPINAKPTTTAAIPIQALLYAVITSKIINAIVSKIPTCSTTQSLIPAKSNGSTPFQRNKKSRSEEHTSELQSRGHLVCRLLLEKTKINKMEAMQ